LHDPQARFGAHGGKHVGVFRNLLGTFLARRDWHISIIAELSTDVKVNQLKRGHRVCPTRRSQLIAAEAGGRASKAVALIRVLVSWVFLSEGLQKFLFPDALGAGRFVKIRIPWPQVMAPFVGVVEIVCGSLLLMGVITRLATIPLLIDISVALYSTKIVTLAKNGFWGTMHEARTDVSMLLGLIFLLLVGAGAWSLDAWLAERRDATHG